MKQKRVQSIGRKQIFEEKIRPRILTFGCRFWYKEKSLWLVKNRAPNYLVRAPNLKHKESLWLDKNRAPNQLVRAPNLKHKRSVWFDKNRAPNGIVRAPILRNFWIGLLCSSGTECFTSGPDFSLAYLSKLRFLIKGWRILRPKAYFGAETLGDLVGNHQN